MKIGFGYDIHRLVPDRKFLLGGIEIPFEKGEAGHSDGDVLIHAVIDALLGAAGLKDIGTYFPPGDPQYKDISSRILLEKTLELICGEGYSIGNIDCTVILEQPKLKPYIDPIKETLASDLKIARGQVTVKAKTKEQLGEVGAGNAIEAHAAVLLFSNQ